VSEACEDTRQASLQKAERSLKSAMHSTNLKKKARKAIVKSNANTIITIDVDSHLHSDKTNEETDRTQSYDDASALFLG
jgi:hypothetical protein